MGSTAAARSMDSGEDCSQRCHVGSRLDATLYLRVRHGAASATKLLRRERVATAAGINRACLPLSAH